MSTREEALAELASVFETIAAEYGEKGLSLPVDTTAIVNAYAPLSGQASSGAARPAVTSAGSIRMAGQ